MVRWGLVLGGVAGAALLVIAEFTPLLTIHTATSAIAIKAVQTGSHDSYALLPIALLAAFLTFEAWRSRGRLPLAATGVLGLVTLLIALLGDLPDAYQTGLVGSTASGLKVASSSPSTGFYLEILGALVLLITAVAGLLLVARPQLPRRVRRRRAGRSPTSERRRT